MPTRTTTYPNRIPFVVDQHTLVRNDGRQVDWELVPMSYASAMGEYTITVNQADVVAGDTSITVDALPVALPAGTVLDFGSYAAATVTVNGAVTAGATSITIQSFEGFIPSGTLLYFGTHTDGNSMVARLTADADGTASAITSLTVEAVPYAIEDTSTATFAGGDIVAKLTASAASGATSITVEPLQFAIGNDAEATYRMGLGKRLIPAGTVMAELTSGKVVPRAARPGSETAIGLLATDAAEGDPSAAMSGHGVLIGGVIYENLLPEASGSPATIDATYKTEMQAAGVGTGFSFQQYSDDRES